VWDNTIQYPAGAYNVGVTVRPAGSDNSILGTATLPFVLTAGTKRSLLDFDDDGTTDIAAWRPSDGTWWIQPSSGGVTVTQWARSGDVPVPGDYDNDAKTDIAVWRPSDGTWWIQQSSGGSRLPSGALPTITSFPRTMTAMGRPTSQCGVLRTEPGGSSGLPEG